MKVLIACEYSAIVRDAFIKKGHDAMSCDILPTEKPGPHFQGDVKELLKKKSFDLIIAHPPCTYLCNSGVRWLYNDDKSLNVKRWRNMREGAKFFRLFLDSAPRVCIENPTPSGHAMKFMGVNYSQKIQPWQFGHGETKGICLWLKYLPPLKPTKIVAGREPKVHFASPGKDRGKIRSLFYTGIAKAMSNQWG